MCNLRSFQTQEIGPRSITLAGSPVIEADRAAGEAAPGQAACGDPQERSRLASSDSTATEVTPGGKEVLSGFWITSFLIVPDRPPQSIRLGVSTVSVLEPLRRASHRMF